jgi:hypothetical protein
MTDTLIKLRRSAVPGKIPSDAQLQLGEVAINTYDGKMFFKQSSTSNTILQVATTSLNLSDFASTTSAQLASIISDEIGTGSLVFSNAPTLVTPVINGNTTFDSGTLFIDSVNNRVGVGTISPTQQFEATTGKFSNVILGTDSADASKRLSIFYDPGVPGAVIDAPSNRLLIRTFGSERMRVEQTGFVGIGNTAPSERLHVDGNIRLSGAVVDYVGSKGTLGQVLTSDGSKSYWADPTGGGSGGIATASQSIVRDIFTGNSAASSYTLSTTPIAERFVIVTINGIVQQDAAYSVAGTSLVFDEPLANTDVVEARTFVPYNPFMTDASATFANTSPSQVLDTFDSTLYRTAKYLVQIANTSSYQAAEVLLIHDGSQVFITEYAQLATGTSLGVIDADISGGNVRLLVNPSFPNVTAKSIRYSIGV